MNLFTLLAWHTNDPGDHYRRAAELFGQIDQAAPGSHGPGMSQWSGMSGGDTASLLPLVAIVVVLALVFSRGGGERKSAKAATTSGLGMFTVLGVVAVVGVLVATGGIG